MVGLEVGGRGKEKKLTTFPGLMHPFRPVERVVLRVFCGSGVPPRGPRKAG